jgi:hypothetical protein
MLNVYYMFAHFIVIEMDLATLLYTWYFALNKCLWMWCVSWSLYSDLSDCTYMVYV